jgi:molybdate transport system permease protein
MSSEVLNIALFTIVCAALATALMLVPGIAVAWLLARHSFPGKAVVETVVSLPLVVPPVATGRSAPHSNRSGSRSSSRRPPW